MQEAKERELYETYTAQAMWTLAQAVYGLAGAEFNMPQYVEMIHPEMQKNQPTAQQIKEHVLKRLEG